MRHTLYLSLGILLLTLSACHTMAEIEGDGYRVRTDTGGYHDGHRGGSRHCPPGHAKKGWC